MNPWREYQYRLRKLGNKVLVVLALREMGLLDARTVKRLLRLRDLDEAVELIFRVTETPDDDVREAMDSGLPLAISGVALYGQTVQCPYCHSNVTVLPCLSCRLPHFVPVLGELVQESRPLPRITLARPGSPEKVEVLRKRYESGVALWHPLDARRLP